MKSRHIISAVLSSLLIVGVAFGQRMGRQGVSPQRVPLIEKLNLTDAQRKDFEKLRTDFATRKVEQQAKVKVAAIELRSLMQEDNPDRAAIEKKVNEISDLQAHNRMLRVDHWFAVNKILNPDQQKIWKDMLNHPFQGQFAARGQGRGNRMMMHTPQRCMMQGGPGQ